LSLLRINMSPGKQKNPKRKEEDGTALKQAFNYSYFKRPKRSRGRPQKAGNLATDEITLEGLQVNEKQRAVPAPSTYSKKPQPKAPPVTESSKKAVKATRVNWSKDDAKQKLENAVSDWEDECSKALDSNGESLKLVQEYSNVVGIPYNALKKYVSADVSKRRVIGRKGVGRQPIVPKKDQHFVADVLAQKDRGNDGATPSEALDMINDLHPELSREQMVRDHFRNTLKPNHPHLLKLKSAVAQATTTKRTAITVTQQYRWYKTIDEAYNFTREENTGKCNLTGKTFGELMHHFITGGDETCIMACKDGYVRIVGARGKKKYKKRTSDSRASITMYRTGSVAGKTGPMVFLMKGKKK
jgi:hypothetical protein